jgi:hypothetical protein
MTLAEYLKSDNLDPIRANIIYQRAIIFLKMRKKDYELSEDRLKGKIPEEYFNIVHNSNQDILKDSIRVVKKFKNRYNL